MYDKMINDFNNAVYEMQEKENESKYQEYMADIEREEKKEQEPKTLVEYLQSKPIEVKIDSRQDYDNIINYLEEQGVAWSSGDDLSELDEYQDEHREEEIKSLTFWYWGGESKSNGLMYNTKLDKMENITVRNLFEKFNIVYKELLKK